MVDSGPYPSDGEGRPPRKHRSGRTGTHDRDSEFSDRNSNERKQHRDRYQNHEDREPRRPREDIGRSQYQEREQRHEERRQDRQQRDRDRDRYRERDQKYEDSRHSRSHTERGQSHYEDNRHSRSYTERSQPHYKEREDYRSEKSYNQYQGREEYHKERSHNRSDERERQQERYARSPDPRGYPADSKFPDHYDPSERSFPPNGAHMHEMEYYEESGGGILDCHKCRYLCTGRACCQFVEVLLNMLILICCSVSYNSTGGYTGITNLGGIYYYQFGGAFDGFSGADGEKAQKLDVQFYNLKLPTVTASMAFGGALMAFCCLLVLLGVLRVPWKWPIWLLVEFVLDIIIALGYIPALYFYFQKLQEAYSSQVCKDREALYSSKGYQGFSCALHGADIAAALFACMAIIAFFMSAFLAIRGFRTVRRIKKKPATMLEF